MAENCRAAAPIFYPDGDPLGFDLADARHAITPYNIDMLQTAVCVS
jgi:hypothetical protein